MIVLSKPRALQTLQDEADLADAKGREPEPHRLAVDMPRVGLRDVPCDPGDVVLRVCPSDGLEGKLHAQDLDSAMEGTSGTACLSRPTVQHQPGNLPQIVDVQPHWEPSEALSVVGWARKAHCPVSDRPQLWVLGRLEGHLPSAPAPWRLVGCRLALEVREMPLGYPEELRLVTEAHQSITYSVQPDDNALPALLDFDLDERV
mmetsp:Transcript_113896/g.317151  ORF Transcript_113896/g.317151 Transcript_113896/m.317151 type:complete len:203 (+) Transcript_113896:350-958(+)